MGIGAGINFSASGVLQALSNLKSTVIGEVTNTIASLVGPWRPPQWAAPAVTTITVPGSAQRVAGSSPSNLGTVSGISAPGSSQDANTALGGIPTFQVNSQITTTPDVIYVFDGVLKLEHAQEIELTKHPVQIGGTISDHAFIKAARLSMDILMSDAMQSYIVGQWSGASSKSVNCYQTLLTLALSRTPLTITTRLNTYTNMVIVGIPTIDDYKTKFALRTTIHFEQVFLADTATQNPVSARQQDTGTTGTGTVPTTITPDVVTNNYLQPTPLISAPVVSGAGNWSSNPVADDPGGS